MEDDDRIADGPYSWTFGIIAGMDVEELIARHPQVFHTMSATAWPSVQQHGLLSTRQLIDLFGLDAGERERLLSVPRKQSTVLRASSLPPTVIATDRPRAWCSRGTPPPAPDPPRGAGRHPSSSAARYSFAGSNPSTIGTL
ncbi:DUF7002 family protein [Micromonospora noduli]|uniref:DUF7002 family protein n=1 Tax=Micromonospora noduli TaxID=709876 RepID=UPI0011BE56F6|nr:hypothetical protein [Micromonospora noduli]